nr:aminotransferase class I/II-fold pyridoxal phosphate-dependent enzyme [Lysinibacter cavernae]
MLSSPDVGELEENYLINAFRSGWIAPVGPDLNAFESELAERVGVAHGVALSSGTAALHLALLGVGVQPGDIVITSTMTFAATANSITYTGAQPYFVDSDPLTGNIDPDLVEQALESLTREGKRVGALLPVDLLGKAVDYTRLSDIAAKYGVPLVADAAESLGASHGGRQAGSFGTASAVSFNGNKIITSSGGGMLLSNSQELADRARYLSTQARQPVAHYEHTDIGYNYRLSNLLAALGRAQLSRLDSMMAKRARWRSLYRDAFSSVPGVTIFGAAREGDDADDNYWLTSILVDEAEAGWAASELSAHLTLADIESRPLWKPMHLQPIFVGAPSLTNGVSERFFDTGLTLPSGSVLSEEQFGRVLTSIQQFLGERG